MVLDWIPDPANLWRKNPYHDRANMVFPTTPTDHVLQQKLQLHRMHPEIRQYPLLVSQGDVPVHIVGAPKTKDAYEPVPVRKTSSQNPAENHITHFTEGPTFTAQGEVRDHLLHPFHHLGYSLTHHPIDLIEQIWAYARHALGWVVGQYTDFFQQIQHWDGSWYSFRQISGIMWRGAIVAALTLGFVELGPLLQALATWLYLMFDFIKGALGLVGTAVDELWYLLTRIWADVTAIIPSF